MASKFQLEVDEAFGDVKREIMNDVTDAVKEGLTLLEEESPIQSGWYEANHRVSFSEDVPLDPPQKPLNVANGELAVTGLARREAPKLEEAELGDIIYIGNAVPYAKKLEDHGSKTRPEGGFYRRASLKIANNIGND